MKQVVIITGASSAIGMSRADLRKQLEVVSQYVYDVGEKIEAGATWYDVASDIVGPDNAPPLVRHRMRLAGRRLTRKPPGALRVLLDILEAASS